MMKTLSLSICVSLLFFSLHAQDNIAFSPVKPHPGQTIRFVYTPPATLFSTTDIIECVAYKWGPYEDEFLIANGNNPIPIDIRLKKNGNSFEGEVKTDEFTTMVSLSFTSGDLKWKRVENKMVLTSGKADRNNGQGYFVQFYSEDEKICRYANYFTGEYLFLESKNKTGFSNPDKAADYFLKELEAFPDSKYYAYSWLSYAMANKMDDYKKLAAKELETLFASGLPSENDWLLVSSLSSHLKLREQSRFFQTQAYERYIDSLGIMKGRAIWNRYATEKDFGVKAQILEELTKYFNILPYFEKAKLAFSTGVPMIAKSLYLQELAGSGRTEDIKSYMVKFNLSIRNNPYEANMYKRLLDTMLNVDNCRDYAIQLAQEYYEFYSDRIAKIDAGAQLPPTPYDQYFSNAGRKEAALSGAACFSDLCGQISYDAGQYKKGFQYAREAQKYMNRLSTPFWDVADYNSRYCLLAEKVLPAKECKAEVEKLVSEGAWKQDMIDILKRLYVKEKKTEAGFEDYIASLKQLQTQLLTEALKKQMINETAPDFSLTDLNGKTVSLSDFRGRTVILDFWATWCGPCKVSFPAMTKLIEAKKNDPKVVFLFVNTLERLKDENENREKVMEFIKTNNYPFNVVYDFNSRVSSDYKVTGIPTKCIVDKEGKIRYRIVGAETDEAKLIDEMNAMIETIK